MRGDEYYLLGLYCEQLPGEYEGYVLTDKGVIVNGMTYRLRIDRGMLYLNNKRMFGLDFESDDIHTVFGDITDKGTVIVGRVADSYFSMLFRESFLSGWQSYDDKLFVCDGGGASF